MSDYHRIILILVLHKRLLEVKKLLQVNEKSLLHYNSSIDNSQDYEEILRLIMVKYYPRIKKKSCSFKNIKTFFYLLEQIYPLCFNEDLRYFDAYNNAYELIVKKKWDKEITCFYIIPFLKAYYDILYVRCK